jgi:hypothetical protein
MSAGLRRTLLGVGVILLVGGWGVTRYVETRQGVIADGRSETVSAWVGKRTKTSAYVKSGGLLPGRTAYLIGIVGMSAGALLLVFTYPHGGRG